MSLSNSFHLHCFVDWCVAVAAGVGGAAGQGRRGEDRRRRADAAVININS